jgi:hypothetical protein
MLPGSIDLLLLFLSVHKIIANDRVPINKIAKIFNINVLYEHLRRNSQITKITLFPRQSPSIQVYSLLQDLLLILWMLNDSLLQNPVQCVL